MSRKTILIADDDVPMLQALAVRLRSEGYDVILSQDWHQALERARVNEPDVLMVNTTLAPEADMEAARRAIEQVVDLATTPLIAITNDSTLRSEEAVRQLGALEHLPKPFEPARLLGAIKSALTVGERLTAQRTQ